MTVPHLHFLNFKFWFPSLIFFTWAPCKMNDEMGFSIRRCEVPYQALFSLSALYGIFARALGSQVNQRWTNLSGTAYAIFILFGSFLFFKFCTFVSFQLPTARSYATFPLNAGLDTFGFRWNNNFWKESNRENNNTCSKVLPKLHSSMVITQTYTIWSSDLFIYLEMFDEVSFSSCGCSIVKSA